jgi:hypothetical protein
MRPEITTRRPLYGLVLLVVGVGVWTVPLAGQRALAAEEDYVADRLSDTPCLTDWGVNEGAGPSRDASITKLSTSGTHVRVTVPYAYTTEHDGEPIFADTASEATYVVTPVTTRRVGGDALPAC